MPQMLHSLFMVANTICLTTAIGFLSQYWGKMIETVARIRGEGPGIV